MPVPLKPSFDTPPFPNDGWEVRAFVLCRDVFLGDYLKGVDGSGFVVYIEAHD